MELHESGEMYLETILILKNRFGYVRSIDIAHELDIQSPAFQEPFHCLRKTIILHMTPTE